MAEQEPLSDYELRFVYERKLDAKLREYGAATFGSLRRREERLQRFIEMECKKDKSRMRLKKAILEAQEAVRQRSRKRADEILAQAQETYFFARLWSTLQNGFLCRSRRRLPL